MGERPEAGLFGEPAWAGGGDRDCGDRQRSRGQAQPDHWFYEFPGVPSKPERIKAGEESTPGQAGGIVVQLRDFDRPKKMEWDRAVIQRVRRSRAAIRGSEHSSERRHSVGPTEVRAREEAFLPVKVGRHEKQPSSRAGSADLVGRNGPGHSNRQRRQRRFRHT